MGWDRAIFRGSKMWLLISGGVRSLWSQIVLNVRTAPFLLALSPEASLFAQTPCWRKCWNMLGVVLHVILMCVLCEQLHEMHNVLSQNSKQNSKEKSPFWIDFIRLRKTLWTLISKLLGGLEHEFYFSRYWEFHHPNWLIFFRGVGQPPTRKGDFFWKTKTELCLLWPWHRRSRWISIFLQSSFSVFHCSRVKLHEN